MDIACRDCYYLLVAVILEVQGWSEPSVLGNW
jgi:hypothetical protein